jgi:two-component system chemotaxis sensor kinase CheA
LLRELYNAVLRTRLLPFGQALEGLDRLARDLAESLGRQVQVVIEGADTEVDRSVLEPVRDLVVHLLHNALAHGLEPPQERRLADKLPVGTVRISARPVESGTLIEVADDGRGLDRQAVAARAITLGLCTAEQAAEMADAHLWAFLARPGFSTRDSVDQVSGRGMGLNAVRQGVDALRGRLEIDSRLGLGMTVRLWLPSLMALEEMVLVRLGPEMYAIPQAVVEHTCPAGTEDIPVLNLRERLHVPAGESSSNSVLIVCRFADRHFGLLVDGIAGRDEAVIKLLPRCARRPYLLGAIVTGAGEVTLALDIECL